MGDLKLVERPQNYTLGPGAQQAIRCVRSQRASAALLPAVDANFSDHLGRGE